MDDPLKKVKFERNNYYLKIKIIIFKFVSDHFLFIMQYFVFKAMSSFLSSKTKEFLNDRKLLNGGFLVRWVGR